MILPENTHAEKTWSESYGTRHQLRRVREFPPGIDGPNKVRLYARRDHFVLQWWDKTEQRTLNERVDGDLVTAIARAREIDERLQHFRSSGRKSGRLRHADLVERYQDDLRQRADAGEIDVATVRRYSSALQRHYLAFIAQPQISRTYQHVGLIDREFQRAFAAYLSNVQVTPNGHPHSRPRPLRRPAFVMDVVRAMLEWAADPDRGRLLPEGFRNPFAGRTRSTHDVATDPLSTPDVTVPMAVNLIGACDRFQLALFAPLLLYGLRPGELGWLFREQVEGDWLRVDCLPELDYLTKGRRNKGFPVSDSLRTLWAHGDGGRREQGLLYVNRRAARDASLYPLIGTSYPELVEEYRTRCAAQGRIGAEQRRRLRNRVLSEAGQLTYDHVQAEFQQLSQSLDWPAAATLKDLRHLFATLLENAGVPEFVRRYLMGHSVGRTALAVYTHISEEQVRQHYQSALDGELAPLVEAVQQRSRALGIAEFDAN